MKLIPLTQGQYAQVSDEDYDHLMKFNCYAYRHRHRWYASREEIRHGKRRIIRMHREIISAPPIHASLIRGWQLPELSAVQSLDVPLASAIRPSAISDRPAGTQSITDCYDRRGNHWASTLDTTHPLTAQATPPLTHRSPRGGTSPPWSLA